MCWHNCQAWSLSDPVYTELDTRTLLSTQPREEKSASLRDSEDFLLVDDGDNDKILIFATEENLRLMSDADAFYIDGTFSTCPSLFYQHIPQRIPRGNKAPYWTLVRI